MATTVGDVAVRVGADIGPLQRSMRKGGRSLDKFNRQAIHTAKRVAAIGSAAAVASIAIGVKLVAATNKSIDAQAKLARQLDGTIDGLRAVQLAGSDAGVEAGVLNAAMERLTSRLGEAMEGTGEAAKALEMLGLNASDLADMDIDERMATIADRMQDMGLNAAQAGNALRDFGVRNGEVINLMRQGGDAIRNASAEVDKFGLSLSEVDAAKVEAANDAMSRVGLSAQGVLQTFSVELAPAIEAVATEISNQFAQAGNDMSDGVQRAAHAAVESFADILDAAAGVIEFVDNNEALVGFGLIGRIVLGKRGLLIGSVTGAIFDQIRDQAAEASPHSQTLANALRDVADSARMVTEQGIEIPPFPEPPDPPFTDVKEVEEAAETEREIMRRQAGEYMQFQLQRAKAAKETLEKIKGWTDEERQAFSEMISHSSDALQAFAGLGAQLARNRVSEERRAADDIVETMQQRLDSSENMTKEEEKAVREAAKNKIKAREQEARRAFETQKNMQKAAVAVNTAAAIMMHLATDPNPFAKWAGVAAIAATGATQLAAINGASFGGGFSMPSGGGGGASQAQGGGQQGGGQRSVNLNLSLVGDSFSRNQVMGLGRDMVDEINNALDDGAQLRVNS